MQFKPKPSIDDVARLARVSTATVSRSLNEPERVKRETLEAVRNAVEELGYTPHFGGRALASNKTNTIGAIIPTMDNAIFARGIQALEETLAQAGVTLLVATSGYDPLREAEQIKTMLGRGIDGLMLIGEARPEETYTLVERQTVPVVLAWTFRRRSEHLCVGFDNRKAASMITEHVLDLGHSRVAMIAGVAEGNDRAAQRIAGVRRALESRGLTLLADHLIEVKYDRIEAAAAMEKLMALPVRPTAIMCGNDVLAVGALMYARDAGITVPTDVSVVGFDNIDLASVVEPPLTTVQVPHRRMGKTAAELLLALCYRREKAASVEFETELVIRESLGPPKH
ncbi:MAG: LacI family DNA-binding transcriptional regulator [Methyloligellaceae bacterium]